jgi:hypothetical protein
LTLLILSSLGNRLEHHVMRGSIANVLAEDKPGIAAIVCATDACVIDEGPSLWE